MTKITIEAIKGYLALEPSLIGQPDKQATILAAMLKAENPDTRSEANRAKADEVIIKYAEAARRLSLSVARVRQLVKDGSLVAVRRPDCKAAFGVTSDSVLAYIDRCLVKSEGRAA